MAKKKKLQSQAPVLTRGQLSRAERERRRIRNLYTGAAIVSTLVVLVLGYALINTYVVRPNAEVAKVGDVTITRDTYNKLRRYNVYTSLNSSASYEAATGQSATNLGLPAVADLQAQLKGANTEQTLDAATVNELVDDEVLRQKSPELGVNPSREELVAAQVKDFLPQPTPVPTTPTPAPPVTPSAVITGTATATPSTPLPTSTPTRTPTAGSPTATSTATATLPPVPGAQQTAEAFYPRFIKAMAMGTSPSTSEPICQYGCPNISEEDLLRLVLDPRVRKQQVTDKLASTQVITEVAQINVQRIVTGTKAGAETLKARIDKGEDFATVANEQSSDQPANGGNIGWITKEGSSTVTDTAFSEKAMALTEKVGQVSAPLQVADKWYIVKILDRADKRPREQSQIDSLKTKAYDDWFKKAKDSYGNRITTKLPALPSVPTQPAVTEPTTAPAQLTPQGTIGPPAPPNKGTVTGTVGITNTVPLTGTIVTTPVQMSPQPQMTAPPPTPAANGAATASPTR